LKSNTRRKAKEVFQFVPKRINPERRSKCKTGTLVEGGWTSGGGEGVRNGKRGSIPFDGFLEREGGRRKKKKITTKDRKRES